MCHAFSWWFQEAFGPQLQALESRLQQEISRKAKEVEGKVVGLQHDLEGETKEPRQRRRECWTRSRGHRGGARADCMSWGCGGGWCGCGGAGLEEKVVEAEETGKTREAALSTLQKE